MRPILVASNIVCDGKKILLGRRADNGLWEFPGGKVEEESIVDAGRREHIEETGMILVGEPVFVGLSDGWEWVGCDGNQWYVCAGYLWTKWVGEPKLVEGKHLEWRWFAGPEMPKPCECTYGTRDLMKIMINDVEKAVALLTS